MFKNKFLIIITAIIFCTVSVYADDFKIQKLSNGQVLVTQSIKNNPIVTIDTWIKTGSINETDINSGVSHFLEHLFFKGTKKYPAGEFDKILESKGAIVNAATSKDFTHYYITIPSEYFERALELHADMLLHPQIPRKELEKERSVVIEEISKDENTPSKKVYDNLNEMLYTNHPYKRKVIGDANVITTISREDILDYYNRYYTPSNMVTLIVGDIDADKASQKVAEYFNANVQKDIKNKYVKEKMLQTQKRKTEYFNTQSGYMMIGFRGQKLTDKDTYALDVLSQILGGGKASKLYRNIKEQKGLAYSIESSNGSYKDDGIFYITANFIPTNAEKLEKTIFDEILYVQKYGVTDEELNIAKNMIEQETYYSRESTSNIAEELGYTITLTGNADFYKNYISNIKNVSQKDIQRVAQKYLGVNKSAVSIGLPEALKQKPETVETKPVFKFISERNGINKYIVNEELTLLINKCTNNDIIAISIVAKGGEFLEGKIGEGTMLANSLLLGTKKYSSQELAQIMEENGIKIEPVCNEDYFKINIQTTTAQIDKTLDILNELINNAIFDDYEIEKKRTEILSKIHQKRDVPLNIALENFKTLIYKDSVYSHSNKIIEKSLPKITKNDLLSYYRKIFDAKNIIISVNGNVEEEKLINSFGKVFKNTKNPKVNLLDYKVTKLNVSEKSVVTIPDLQTAWIFYGWQTSGITDKKDFVTLKVINTILGSGLSSRLYRNLREQNGLAYQLGSSYKVKYLGGIFMTYIGTNPKTLDFSLQKINEEMKRLKMQFVSDVELQNAKDRLTGGVVVALETNSEKAAAIAQFEALGYGYDFLDTYIKMINEVTASDIIRVANKYFTDISVLSIVK